MMFINNKRSKQFFYQLTSNYGRKFSQSPSHQVLLKVSHRQIPNFSGTSTRFPKQFKDIFSFMKFKDFSRLALNSRPAQEPVVKLLCFATVFHKYCIFVGRNSWLNNSILTLNGINLNDDFILFLLTALPMHHVSCLMRVFDTYTLDWYLLLK